MMDSIGFINTHSTTEKKESDSQIVPLNFTHSVAIGETGSGKTTNYIYPNLKDRIKRGHGILLYDYKGKEHLVAKKLAYEHGRLDDVVEINKPWGASINLLKFMSFSEISKFLKDLQGRMIDVYWSNFAANISLPIIKIAAAYDEFEKLGMRINKEEYIKFFSSSEYQVEGLEEYRDSGFCGKSITSVIKSSESLSTFKNFIGLALKLEERCASFIYHLSKNYKLDSEIKELIRLAKKVEKAIHSSKPILQKFADLDPDRADDQKSRILQNYFQCILSYSDIGLNEMLNSDEHDIPSLLEDGKIVILNLQSFHEEALSHITDSTLKELSKRVTKSEKRPISVFVDEAQKVVSRGSTLYSDVLREAEVELFLSFQNPSLMIERLEGLSSFMALMGNLVSKFYFKSSSYTEEFDPLQNASVDNEIGEFIDGSSGRKTKGQPIIFTPQELLNIEYLYQKRVDVQSLYFKRKKKDVIVIHDQSLYEKGKVMTENTKTNHREVVDIDMGFSKKDIDDYLEQASLIYSYFEIKDSDELDDDFDF